MKKIIILLIMLSCLTFVSASTPNYQVAIDIPNTLTQGINTGNILITRDASNPDDITMSQCQNVTIQKFDNLYWRGTEQQVIQVDSMLLTDTNYRQFLSTGSFIFDCNNTDYKVTVIDEDDYNINIDNNQFEDLTVLYSINDFTLHDTEIVEVEINLGNKIEADSYDLDFIFSNNINNNKTNITEKIFVKENREFSITQNTLNDTINITTAESLSLGNINFKNVGNIDYNLNITVNGNISSLIIAPGSQKIYIDSYAIYNFNIVVPSSTKRGMYSGELIFDNGDYNYTKKINITVRDSIAPIIDMIEFDNDLLYVPNKISAIIKDNIEVASATVSYLGNTYNLSNDNQKYYLETNFTNSTEYIFNICASDEDNNFVCREVTKTFEKLDAFNITDNSLTMPTMKSKTYSKRLILNNYYDIKNQKICLKNFNDENNYNKSDYEIRLIDEENDYKFFGTEDCLTLYDGNNYLEIKLDDYSEYTLELHLNTSKFIQEYSIFRIKGQFLNYEIADDFVLEWNGVNEGYKCNAIDTGEYETSYMKCIAKYPIDIKASDISIPTTVRERQKFDEEVQEQDDEYNKDKKMLSFLIILFFITSVIAGAGVYYVLEIFPYHRFSLVKNSDIQTEEDYE